MAGLMDLISAASTPSTDVEGIDVAPAKRPPSPPPVSVTGLANIGPLDTSVPDVTSMGSPPSNPQLDPGTSQNYNNSSAVQAVRAANDTNAPRGGSDNPGLYGLLPQNLQHGTLRNVLGALGDAFLVGSGGQATYSPRMQRQEIGDAMAGYDQNPQAAIQRVADTGAPGAAEMASKLEQQRQMMEYTQQYRQQMLGNKNENVVARMAPQVGGMFAGITDPNMYAQRYKQADAIAKRIDPSYDPSVFGLPSPEEWQPSMTAHQGMTGNNIQVSSDKAAQRGVSVSNNTATNRSRIQAAGIAAGGHVTAANISSQRPSEAGTLDDLQDKQDSGQTLTPAEQQRWDRGTHITQGRGGRPPLIGVGGNTSAGPSNINGISVQNYGANNPVANNGKPLTPAQAQSLKGHGVHFLGTNGKWYIS